MPKLFTFSAESFGLSPEVEALLRSKNAIFMDFGSSAYVKSEGVSSIMLELMSIDKSSQTGETTIIDAEKEAMQSQLEKLNKYVPELIGKLDSKQSEVVALNGRVEEFIRAIEGLKAENLRLSALVKSNDLGGALNEETGTTRAVYEKLQSAFQDLRSQHIEAIASLKVLEEENDELRKEIESLRNQANAARRT
jgi:peptidoglycan hydrolase CwlO-like protein